MLYLQWQTLYYTCRSKLDSGVKNLHISVKPMDSISFIHNLNCEFIIVTMTTKGRYLHPQGHSLWEVSGMCDS